MFRLHPQAPVVGRGPGRRSRDLGHRPHLCIHPRWLGGPYPGCLERCTGEPRLRCPRGHGSRAPQGVVGPCVDGSRGTSGCPSALSVHGGLPVCGRQGEGPEEGHGPSRLGIPGHDEELPGGLRGGQGGRRGHRSRDSRRWPHHRQGNAGTGQDHHRGDRATSGLAT